MAGRLVAVVLAAVLFVSCQQQAINAAIERSSAPVLVPTGDWRGGFEFTAPPGSTDLYQFRWNFRAGATDIVAGWQVATTSSHGGTSMAEGPGQDLLDEVTQAARGGQECELVDAERQLRLCLYPAEFARDGVNAYLVRPIDDHVLVVDYLNLDADRRTYNPTSLEARYLAGDFEPIPIDGNIDDYLTSFN
jgi:hypothetical protein